MLVCCDHKFVCVLPAHTASTSLQAALSSIYRITDLEPHHYVSQEYFDHYKDFLTISSVRNPYTRLISHYRHSCDRKRIPTHLIGDAARLQRTIDANTLGFEKYCLKYAELMEPITEILAGMSVRYFVKQENFVKDLQKLPLPNIRRAKIYMRNRKPRICWQDYYRRYPAMIDWVKTRYRDDFQQFVYSDELEP